MSKVSDKDSYSRKLIKARKVKDHGKEWRGGKRGGNRMRGKGRERENKENIKSQQ